MSEVAIEAPDAQKARKAELKAAKKAKKAAKEQEKLAKKTERKVEKQAQKQIEASAATPEAKLKASAKKSNAGKAKTILLPLYALSIGAKLQSVARQIRANLAAQFLQHGLYAGQEQVLFMLDEHGPLSLAELAEKLDVRAPTITKTVTRMEAQGFLSRAISRDDARSVIISLTPGGRRMLKIGREIVQNVESKTFSVLSAADCESLQKYLDLVFLQIKHQQ
jgi:DNA-binding MarR family transcriptional regulator